MEIQTLECANAPIRVLLVDDHVLLREGLCLILEKEAGFEVIGEAEHGKAAAMLAMEVQPDIVLLNSLLESSHPLDVAKQLLQICPYTRIVLFASPRDEQFLFDAIRIGVHGYLHKTISRADLLKSLLAVQSGERVLGETHAVTQVVNEFHRLAKEESRLRRGLSSRDIEVVQLASQGYTNKEIGIRLYWSEVQVKRKMQDIYRKLQVADRAQAVAEAIRQGLI